MPFHFSKEEIKKQLDKTLETFRDRLSRIHTGQVNPGLIENISVSYQGFEMKLLELASIRTEGPRTLVVEPWDKNAAMDIEKAILQSKHGVAPQLKGSAIYLSFPSITQENRVMITREIKKMEEEERVAVRQIRDSFWEAIKKAEEEGEIREDDKFKFKEQLQEIIDDYNKKVEEMTERKIKSLE